MVSTKLTSTLPPVTSMSTSTAVTPELQTQTIPTLSPTILTTIVSTTTPMSTTNTPVSSTTIKSSSTTVNSSSSINMNTTVATPTTTSFGYTSSPSPDQLLSCIDWLMDWLQNNMSSLLKSKRPIYHLH